MSLITRGFGETVEYNPVIIHEFEVVLNEIGKKVVRCHDLKPEIKASVEKKLRPYISSEKIE